MKYRISRGYEFSKFKKLNRNTVQLEPNKLHIIKQEILNPGTRTEKFIISCSCGFKFSSVSECKSRKEIKKHRNETQQDL